MDAVFDVIIVGAGPAGCACAHQLAGKGLKVAVLDKAVFPRDKICGDALSRDVVNQLHWLDPAMGEQFLEHPQKFTINGVRFYGSDYQSLDLRKEQGDHHISVGYVIKRMEFDAFLIDQIRGLPDIQLIEDCRVKAITTTDEEVRVTTNGKTFRAQMIVGADGANSVVNRQLSANKPDKAHLFGSVRQYFEGITMEPPGDLFEFHFYQEIQPGYFWIFPLPNNQFNVGLGMLSNAISKKKVNLKEMLTSIIQEHPQLKDRFKEATPLDDIRGFGIPVGSRKVACSGNRFLLLGDAASLVDPFTGEGIANAIRSGRVAAQHIERMFKAQRFDARFNAQYDQEIYRKMWKELRISRTLQRLLRYPKLCNRLMRKARTNPAMQSILISMWDDVKLRKQLRDPRFYARLLFG